MRRNLGLRIGLVIVVIAVSVWYLYPPRSSINLGLDLQGGIHLVLGVDVDKALEAQVERAGDTVRGELEKKGIAVSKIERRGRIRWLADNPNFIRLAHQRTGPFRQVLLDILASQQLAFWQIPF